jgi:hypothetical protein
LVIPSTYEVITFIICIFYLLIINWNKFKVKEFYIYYNLIFL